MSLVTRLKLWFRRMLGLSINLATPSGGVIGAIPGATGTASFVDGGGSTVSAPILGQPLFVSPGTFSGSPTVYDYQVYASSVAIGDATGTWNVSDPAPSYIPTDDIVGATLVVKCHGRNSSGTSPTTNDSSATSAVTDIGTSGVISGTPISAFTRTSSSGVTPMTWSVTFGANVYEGYYLHAEVFPTSSCVDGTQEQVVDHLLTHDDLQSGATIDLASDGLTSIGATKWLQLTVWTVSPNALGYSFVYPTPISPTDAVVAMTWSPTDKTSGVSLSGGNLIATQGGGPGSIRTSRAVGYDLTYIEIVGGQFTIAVADASADLTTQWGSAIDGLTATTHAGSYTTIDGGQITYNGSPRGDVGGYISTDTVQIALDRVNKKVWFGVNNSWKNGTPGVSGGLDCTGIGTPLYFAMQAANGAAATLNAGTTPGGTAGFTYTPPTGFVAP